MRIFSHILRTYIGVVVLAVLSSACSQGGQLTLNSTGNGVTAAPGVGAEFVSSSTPRSVSTPNGYVIQQTLGTVNPELVQTSTKGYKLYSSVQGELISPQ